MMNNQHTLSPLHFSSWNVFMFAHMTQKQVLLIASDTFSGRYEIDSIPEKLLAQRDILYRVCQ